MKWLKWFIYGVGISLAVSAGLWAANVTWAYTANEPMPKAIKIVTGSIGIFLLYILLGVYGVVKHLIKSKR